MALSAEQHSDLKIRLEQLIAEYAAASDRSAATDKLHAILDRVPVGEEGDPADDDVAAMVAEIEQRGRTIAELRAANEAGGAQLTATQRQLDAAMTALAAAAETPGQ